MLKNQRKNNVFSISWVWPLSSVIKRYQNAVNRYQRVIKHGVNAIIKITARGKADNGTQV